MLLLLHWLCEGLAACLRWRLAEGLLHLKHWICRQFSCLLVLAPGWSSVARIASALVAILLLACIGG